MAGKNQPKILTKKELNSVANLINVKKAVYIMKSATDKNLYRFGGIGVRAKGNEANTAIRRLGQCTQASNENEAVWYYVAMAVFGPRTGSKKVNEAEKRLKEILVGQQTGSYFCRLGRKDAFKTREQQKVVEAFTDAFRANE